MSIIEEKVRKSRRKKETQKAILGFLAVAGITSVAVVAPAIIEALWKLGMGEKIKGWQRQSVARSLQGLVSRGLIDFRGKGNRKFMMITPEGQKFLHLLELRDFKIPKPKRWDKKWRIIIFDIQEKRRRSRDLLRQTLQQIGFSKLQESVWVYPYACEDLIMLLKADLELGKSLLYIVADEIENDRKLREIFDLPKE